MKDCIDSGREDAEEFVFCRFGGRALVMTEKDFAAAEKDGKITTQNRLCLFEIPALVNGGIIGL